MITYAHKVVPLDGSADDQREVLDKMGAEGWELVGVSLQLPHPTMRQRMYGYFKLRVEDGVIRIK